MHNNKHMCYNTTMDPAMELSLTAFSIIISFFLLSLVLFHPTGSGSLFVDEDLPHWWWWVPLLTGEAALMRQRTICLRSKTEHVINSQSKEVICLLTNQQTKLCHAEQRSSRPLRLPQLRFRFYYLSLRDLRMSYNICVMASSKQDT